MYSVTSLSEVKLEKAEKCIYINSNINRLACFDEIFNTPIRKQIVDERALNNFLPKLIGDIFTLARETSQNTPIENSLNYFKSLNEKKIPVSLHIYPIGNHGWGYSKQYKYHEAILKELSLWLQTTLKYKHQ